MSTTHTSPATNTGTATPSIKPHPWDRQPNEDDLWFDRFCTYLNLGPQRSLEQTYRSRKEIDRELTGRRANSAFRRKAEEYNWKARAKAYDEAQRQSVQLAEEERRRQAREHRRTVIETALDKVVAAIDKAELDKMDVNTARMHLQTLRPMLADLLKAHRLEMGEPTEIQDTNLTPSVQFSADDLAEAQRQLAEYFARTAPDA